MNTQISRGFAFTIIVIIAGTLGVLLWLNVEQPNMTTNNQLPTKNKKSVESVCKDHYYEGEARVAGWLVSAEGERLVVQVTPSSLDKMPKIGGATNNLKVRLVDASAELKEKLEGSSSDQPVEMTIKGYATVCDSAVPLVSLEPATKAFKKS